MKGFSQFRGQMFRTSYDPATGEFVNVQVTHTFLSDVTFPENAQQPDYFWPKPAEFREPADPAALKSIKRRA